MLPRVAQRDPALSKRIRKLRALVDQIRERGSTRPLHEPLDSATVDAVEERLGVSLPPDVRAFFGHVTAGEPGHAGVPPLLDPRASHALLDQPSQPFPVDPADLPALLRETQTWKHSQEAGAAPAADVPADGLLTISDHGCAIYDCVVL